MNDWYIVFGNTLLGKLKLEIENWKLIGWLCWKISCLGKLVIGQ